MSEMGPTVFVVDDDPAVADSIRLLLGSVGLTSESYTSATDFLAEFDRERPGCLVVDVRMPGMSGLDLQAELVDRGSTLPIVFITAHGDIPMAVTAMRAGASDFLEKPFREQDLLDRVNEALAENTRLRSEVARKVEARRGLDSLTPREQEVLELILAGRPNKKIARELGISRRTVEIHRARVMEKMGVRSVPLLVRKVMLARS
jgi:RNA polymerase sigma factor (sigma-70 family)